jgi:hypothetical protein
MVAFLLIIYLRTLLKIPSLSLLPRLTIASFAARSIKLLTWHAKEHGAYGAFAK